MQRAALLLLLSPCVVDASTLTITSFTPSAVIAGDDATVSWTSSGVASLPLKLYSPAITTCGSVFTSWCSPVEYDLLARSGTLNLGIPITATVGPTTFLLANCW